ncbi:branched-chain amino acid ABC transporter substrate-binding protein [Frankia sp. CcI49]|uniref:ABC transporter substrate-binding protein n=1 Tax=Frankia sp. CcI49 TaxID=1745382 RepID=UPI000976B7A0|nr:ABC transporter substrate-binding protein [Frankia sp. CcI49]ONH58923.1 branched-chain amino acid ABC transporter substrate-binding protein [Frankia sp. CcI49]
MAITRQSSDVPPRSRVRRRAAGTRLAGLSLLAAILFSGAACGSSGNDRATGENDGGGAGATALLGPSAVAQGAPVRIGFVTDGRNAVADTTVEAAAANATVAYVNEHRSGIGGRPIELVTCQTLSDPSKGTDCGNEMIEKNVAAVLIGSSTVNESAWKPLHDAGVPVMLFASGGADQLADAESTFILSDPTFGTITLPLRLAKDRHASKVTAVVIDVPAALNLVNNVAPKLFEKAGVGLEVVAVPPGTADMTPQMQRVADGGGIVFIVGNDSFCISAMNGLRAVGFDGQVSAVSQCVTDATRKAVPGDALEGTVIAATASAGSDSPSKKLYDAVMATYAKGDFDDSGNSGMNMFTTVMAFRTGTEGITRDVSSESLIAALRSMSAADLTGVDGVRFRCNGKAYPQSPSVCVRGGLTTTLDGDGQPAGYKALGVTPIED